MVGPWTLGWTTIATASPVFPSSPGWMKAPSTRSLLLPPVDATLEARKSNDQEMGLRFWCSIGGRPGWGTWASRAPIAF